VVDHPDDGSDESLVLRIKLCGCFAIEIFAPDGELDPDLRLGGIRLGVRQLADESRFIPTLTPRLNSSA